MAVAEHFLHAHDRSPLALFIGIDRRNGTGQVLSRLRSISYRYVILPGIRIRRLPGMATADRYEREE